MDCAKIRDTWTQFTGDAIGFVYPRACVRCREPLPRAETCRGAISGTPRCCFCTPCYDVLCCAVERACRRCGAPVGPHLDTTHGCRYCCRDRFQFDRVFALGIYKRELGECCARAKQPLEAPLTAGLTELLADAHTGEWNGMPIDVIVPVPHHWSERLSRQQLPPVTMCDVLARRLMVPRSLHILAKSRRTPQQSSLTPARRRANLRNAFRIAGGAQLDGLTVLLTDDILTTGTTADRAARVLKEAGARQVLVAVLARGLGKPAGH